jgi:hypothetical protein
MLAKCAFNRMPSGLRWRFLKLRRNWFFRAKGLIFA